MKKISSSRRNKYDLGLQPYALNNHTHEDLIPKDSNELIEVSTDIVFTGQVSGLDIEATGITAGETVSALRMLSVNSNGHGVYSDPNDSEHARKLFGMSTSVANIGQTVSVLLAGRHEDISWSFDVNLPLYLGPNGTFIQTVPIVGELVVLGYVLTPQIIYLRLQPPIQLG